MTKTPRGLALQYVNEEQLEYEEATGAYYGFLAGYAAAQPKWISVKERLPEHDQLVLYRELVKTKNGQAYEFDYGEYDSERQVFYGQYFNYRWLGWDVTHWMPLPEPPKEEK